MQSHIVGVTRSTKLDAAIKLMERSSVSLLPVMHCGKLVGTVTMEEIKKALDLGLDRDHTNIDRIMSRKPQFVEADMEIDEAARVMIKNRIARLPVVNNRRDMVCVGIISSTEVLKNRNKNKDK
jgi:CBS domain-containing protein